jgi:hypothetical protein
MTIYTMCQEILGYINMDLDIVPKRYRSVGRQVDIPPSDKQIKKIGYH